MSGNNFERAKLRQGFVFDRNRPACSNCKQSSKNINQCMKGGFFTTPLSVCDEHEPMPALPGKVLS